MNLKKLHIVTVLLLGALLINSSGCLPRRGDHIIESWETSNGRIRVRIRQYAQKAFLGLPGYYYTFEVSDKDHADQWREVATIRTDDNVGIPREQVRFINARTAYFFMGQIYAVTLDGGNVWSVWDGAKDREFDGFVKDVRIAPEGTGLMTFYPIPPNSGKQPPDLFTNDYGQHWKSK